MMLIGGGVWKRNDSSFLTLRKLIYWMLEDGQVQTWLPGIVYIEIQKQQFIDCSCFPDPFDPFRQSHVVCLEFVKSNTNHQRCQSQSPPENDSCLAIMVHRDVVDDDGLESRMRVDQEKRTEGGIQDRVQGPADEGCNGQRDKTHSHKSLKSPVIAAVRRMGLRDLRWIIGCTVNDLRSHG